MVRFLHHPNEARQIDAAHALRLLRDANPEGAHHFSLEGASPVLAGNEANLIRFYEALYEFVIGKLRNLTTLEVNSPKA